VTSASRTVLHVSPHPDDELLGAPATLMSLRDAGWRIVNLACSLGRPGDAARRSAELAEACRRARFELLISARLPPIGADADSAVSQQLLAAEIRDALNSSGADLVIGPSREDAHHGHLVVARAITDAIERDDLADDDRAHLAVAQRSRDPSGSVHVMSWGVWRDLSTPNVLVPFGAERLAEIRNALDAHAGELERNRFERLLEGRAKANAVLGPERVFGFGSSGIAEEYAELLHDTAWSPTEGWRPSRPRIFDPSVPFG
jgi:LmbE family N-acetylglucosaminyl deacetylase